MELGDFESAAAVTEMLLHHLVLASAHTCF